MTRLLLLLIAGCASGPAPSPDPTPAPLAAKEAPAAAAPKADRPTTAAGWVRQGMAHRSAGRTDEAEAAYNEAIKLDRDHPDVWFNLGNLQLAAGKADLALEQYDRAVKLRPDDVDAKLNRAYALMALHRYELAAAAFQAVIDQVSGRDEAWNGLGAARHRLGDTAGAVAAFRRAHSLAPDDPRSRFNLGMQLSGPLLHVAPDAAALDEAIALLDGYLAAPLGDPRDTNAKRRLGALRAARTKLPR